MDPVGPWSAYAAASYNRLANATGVSGANDYHRQLAAVGVAPGVSHMAGSGGTATTSHQLLLQAAHASAASAVTTPSAFNPGRFLSPPPVGYDAVFTPLFHQKNSYNAALNQRHTGLKQTGTAVDSNVVGAAADLVSQYGAMHHQSLAAAANVLFDHHQATTSSPSSSSSVSSPATSSSSSASPYQPAAAHSQLHSPFGILPHESVLASGGPSTSKANGTPAFENPFNAHFSNTQVVNHSNNPSANQSAEFCQDNSIKKLNKAQSAQLNKSPSLMTQPTQTVVKSAMGSSLYSTGIQVQQQAMPSVMGNSKFSCKCGLNCSNLQCCLSQQQRMGANVVATSNAPAAVAATSPNNSSVIINNYQNINKPCSQLNNVIVNKSNNNDVNNGNKKTQVNVAMSLDQRQGTDSVQKEQCNSGQSSPVCFAMTAMPPAHRTVTDYNSNSNNNNNSTNMLIKSSPRNVITTAQFNSSHRSAVSPVSYCQNMSTVKTPPIDMLKTTAVTGTQKSPDCSVVMPRRPSPLQAHSQSSPISHVPSPAYPIYNSPVTSVHSPTHQTSQTSTMPVQRQPQNYNNAKQIPAIGGEASLSPLDVSVQRRSICEPLNKNYLSSTSDFNVRQQSNSNARSWETSPSLDRDRLNDNSCQKTNNIINSSSYETATGPQRHVEQQQQQQIYYSCGAVDRSVSVVKQNSVDEKSSPEPCSPATGNSVMKNKRNYEKNNVSHRDLNVPSSSSPSSSSPSPSSLVGRVPPPAHNNSLNQQQSDNYFEYERWNPSSSVKLAGVNSLSESFMENNKHIMSGIYNSNHFINSVAHQTNQSLNLPSATYHPRLSSPLALSNSFYHNPHSHPSSGLHVSLMNPYSHSNAVSPSNDLQNVPVELAGAGAGVAAPPVAVSVNETSADGNPPSKTVDNEHPKVIVPNIEEELDFLLDDKPTISSFGPKRNMAAASEKTASTSNSNNGGFMASYIKFLQGERDTSPPPMGRNTRRTPLTRVKPVCTIITSVTNSTTVTTSTTPSKTVSQSANPPPSYNPEDDPRYFPLPKTSALRGSLDSSDDDNGEFSYFKNLNKKTEQTGNSESSTSSSKPVAETKPDTETTNKSVSNSSNTSNKLVPKPRKTISKSVSNSPKTKKSVSNSCKIPGEKTEKKTNLAESTESSNNDSNKKEKFVEFKRKKEIVNNAAKPNSNKKQRRRKKQPRTFVRLSDGESDDGGKDNNLGDESNDRDFNPVPQRTVPKRKAKENRKSVIDVDEDYGDLDKDDEEKDEDFEPDWNPVEDDDDYLEQGRGKRKRGRLSVRNSGGKKSLSRMEFFRSRRSKRLKSDTVESDDEEPDKETPASSKPPDSKSNMTSEQKQTTENTSTNEVEKKNIDVDKKKSYITVNGPSDKHNLPFNIGEFVVFKSDLVEDWPSIWRVHGKALLQKFEPFEEGGETLYKSMPTFSGCTNKIADNLSLIPFRVRTQNKGEYIVEFLRREFNLTPEEKLVMDTAMKETAKYQDNFEVYIQTLLSQALDSNFLAEIIQEKDEYFLVNMKAIDDLTERHRSRVSKAARWDNRIIERSLSTWPCYNILYSVTDADKEKSCESCDLVSESGKISRVIVYGQPYNIESLEGRTPDPDILGHKDMLVCHDCLTTVVLYNKIVHQKYLMFIECAKRVNEKRLAGPDKDTTIILNELLADESWLSQLFKKVRSTWAEVNRFEMNKNLEKTNSST